MTRDILALVHGTRGIKYGQVYRVFDRMRREHMRELANSLARAINMYLTSAADCDGYCRNAGEEGVQVLSSMGLSQEHAYDGVRLPSREHRRKRNGLEIPHHISTALRDRSWVLPSSNR